MKKLNSIIGNASEAEVKAIGKEFTDILTQDEKLVGVVKIRDEELYSGIKLDEEMFVFTDKRLILATKGFERPRHEVQCLSMPYKSITHFSLGPSMSRDHESEVKIWISGGGFIIQKDLEQRTDAVDVQRILAGFVLD